jgi:hypothetical protein
MDFSQMKSIKIKRSKYKTRQTVFFWKICSDENAIVFDDINDGADVWSHPK